MFQDKLTETIKCTLKSGANFPPKKFKQLKIKRLEKKLF